MTECGDIRKQFGCIYMTSSHLITCPCWWKKNHVGCSPVEVMGSMLNEQISCVLVEWSLLAAVSCWGLLLYCIVESPPPSEVVFGFKHAIHPVIPLKRHRNAHRNAPRSVCWHSCDRSALRCRQRCFVGIHSVLSLEKTLGAVKLSRRISRQLRPEWKPGGSIAQGCLVTWVLNFDAQINFCCILSPLLFSPCWMECDQWICLFNSLSSLSERAVRWSCPPACCKTWQRDPFSNKIGCN